MWSKRKFLIKYGNTEYFRVFNLWFITPSNIACLNNRLFFIRFVLQYFLNHQWNIIISLLWVMIPISDHFVHSPVTAFPQLQALWTDGHEQVLLGKSRRFINATPYAQQDSLLSSSVWLQRERLLDGRWYGHAQCYKHAHLDAEFIRIFLNVTFGSLTEQRSTTIVQATGYISEFQICTYSCRDST